ncbi:MAG: tetratricopeptide repeat protein [Anaerolineales bacterium]|nr:tetratricopeptide repeat protein [Anaerolineales bacterium]
MNKKKLITFVLVLILVTLACRVDRVLNPALPTYTPTIGPTPVPTQTPTPTPIPTPEPGARIQSGDAAFANGQWDLALQEYSQAFDGTTENEIKAAAMLGLARTYFKIGQTQAATDTLTQAVNAYPNSNSLADLYFLQGEILQAAGQPALAVESFLRYQQLRPGLIDAYIYQRVGDNHMAAEQYQAAIDAYLMALQSDFIGDNIYFNLRIGDAYLAMDELNTALVTFEDVSQRTQNDYQKAEALRKMGDILVELGSPEQAYLAYAEAVENYPLAYDAYLSLVSLLDAGQSVSDLNRGLINYFVKQYGFAVEAFVRYLRDNPDTHSDTPHYYLGLSYLNLGEYAKAIDAWQAVIDDHLNERNWANAYDEIAYTQDVFLNKPDQAIETYLEFVDRSPVDARAPEFLFYAGRVAERDFDLQQAARLWERIGTQFSTSAYAFEGLFQAGIARYRMGQWENAISTFQSALGVTATPTDQAAAYFWIGKAYARWGYPDAANDAWLQASTSDPTGYYSERAADLMEGREPFDIPDRTNFTTDPLTEKAAAITWMRTIFSIPVEEDLSNPAPLFSDPRMVRGAELWRLNQWEDARREFESYRQAVQDDPAQTFRLANYLIEIGLYRSGIIASRRVLDLAGLDDAGTLTAPAWFNHQRFGLYYRHLVQDASQEYGLDPLLLTSMMRQESLFEGFVTSTAGARGLMQIIPSTGEEISRALNWPPNYTDDDLYRPAVSIPFGASYLNRQRAAFNGDLYAALAAYNGGGGNASKWLALADGDIDLFVEVIRFSETRDYIRRIYELHQIYVGIYGTE